MKMYQQSPAANSLRNLVDQLKEDILERVQPLTPHKGVTVVSCQPLSARAMHKLATVELCNNGTTVRCFAKKTPANYHGPQRLEQEEHILRNISPKIWEANKHARTPQVLAFFPECQLLLLELVEGTPLKKLVFNRNIPYFARLAGEWLARLHATTRAGDADPFVWLETAFTEAKVRTAFRHSSAADVYEPLLELLSRFHRKFANYHQPLCLVHGEFTSLHVLTKEECIYVIDFGSSRTGFGCEDVAFFSTFHNALLPWRHLAGYLRYPLSMQSRVFLQSYFEHRTQDMDLADDIVLRFASIRAVALHASCWEVDRDGWAPNLCSRIGRQWTRRRLAAFVRNEFRSLQEIGSAGMRLAGPNKPRGK